MFLSSKCGSEAILRPSLDNKYEYRDEKQLFMASLICMYWIFLKLLLQTVCRQV